ncbi:hypothetical protein D3C85_1618890 [compost metagenome]
MHVIAAKGNKTSLRRNDSSVFEDDPMDHRVLFFQYPADACFNIPNPLILHLPYKLLVNSPFLMVDIYHLRGPLCQQ